MSNFNTKQIGLLVVGLLIAFVLYYSFTQQTNIAPTAPEAPTQPAEPQAPAPAQPETPAPEQQVAPAPAQPETPAQEQQVAPAPAANNQSNNRFLETIDFKTLPQATIRQSKYLYEEKNNLCNTKPVVVEFFSYGCPGCAQAEPYFNAWKQNNKNNNIEFMKIPVAIHDPNHMLAKAYYTNKAMGLDDERIDAALFTLGTKPGNKINLDSVISQVKSVVPSLNESQYKETYNNISISLINKGNALFHQYRLPGTPSVVVNNKYVIKLNSYDRMFETINYLTQNENTSCPNNG